MKRQQNSTCDETDDTLPQCEGESEVEITFYLNVFRAVLQGLTITTRFDAVRHIDEMFGFPLQILFIHSFIADIYIAPLQVGLLRSAPNPSAAE